MQLLVSSLGHSGSLPTLEIVPRHHPNLPPCSKSNGYALSIYEKCRGIPGYLTFNNRRDNRILSLKHCYYFNMHSLSKTLKTNDSKVVFFENFIFFTAYFVCVG